jgi:hypothetical protein
MLPVQPPLPSDRRPTGQSSHVSLSDHDRDVGADIRRLRLPAGLDPRVAALHDALDRDHRRSGARTLGRAARDHAPGARRNHLASNRYCDRVAPADHLGAVPFLAIEQRSQAAFLTGSSQQFFPSRAWTWCWPPPERLAALSTATRTTWRRGSRSHGSFVPPLARQFLLSFGAFRRPLVQDCCPMLRLFFRPHFDRGLGPVRVDPDDMPS